MPENRFGGVNQQPLYNVTGRMNRGEAPQQSNFQAPAAGVQKDFSASNMPNNAQGTQGGFASNLMESVRWGQGPLNMYGRTSSGGRRGRRGGGGGGGDGDGTTDNSIKIDFGSNNTAFGADSGPKVDNRGIAGNNTDSANDYAGGPPAASGGTTTQLATQGQQGAKPKTPRTDEQRAQRTARDQQNRSGERTPKPRGPRPKPAAVAPAAAASTTTNTNNSTVQANVVDNKSYVGPTTNIGRGGQPAAQGAGQPGNAPFTIGGVKGATASGPASIGPLKFGKK